MKHRLTFTTRELELLKDRLVPISPMDYDLESFSILRSLYGRLDHFLLNLKPIKPFHPIIENISKQGG